MEQREFEISSEIKPYNVNVHRAAAFSFHLQIAGGHGSGAPPYYAPLKVLTNSSDAKQILDYVDVSSTKVQSSSMI